MNNMGNSNGASQSHGRRSESTDTARTSRSSGHTRAHNIDPENPPTGPNQQPRVPYTSHAGNNIGSDGLATTSQHGPNDLEVVPEGSEKGSTSNRPPPQTDDTIKNISPIPNHSKSLPNPYPPENSRRIPYDDYHNYNNFGTNGDFYQDTSQRMDRMERADHSMAMDRRLSNDRSIGNDRSVDRSMGNDRSIASDRRGNNERSYVVRRGRIDSEESKLERSERSHGVYGRVDRSGGGDYYSRTLDSQSRGGQSGVSVVSDVSYEQMRPHSQRSMHSVYTMPVISLAQDSGSLLPSMNTSHKSACSMTAGSKRAAEKRAALMRSGSFVYDEKTHAAKKKEDMALEFTRWGGRKDYSSSHNDQKRKDGIAKIHKRKIKQEKRKSLEDSQGSFHFKDKEERASKGFHNLWGFAHKDDMLQYEQLIKEDKDREKVASFCEEPFWKIIFHFKGTVLRVIIEDILFWLTLATYVCIRIKIRMDETDDVAKYETLSENLTYVGGFVSFFLIFYVNQNHHRYFQLHADSMTLMGRVNDMATLVKAILPMERARRINRYMNAAHVAMYTGLSSTYEKENFFDPLEARFALLTDEELYRIVDEIDVDNSGPKSAFEIITWVMCDIRDAQINSFIDTNEAMQLREQLLDFRSTIAKIFVTTTLPIPFFYVHFLSMLTAVYLPLFAVVNAFEVGKTDDNQWILETVTGLVVFLQALMVIGLRILGQQLSDPYGGDLIDLQIARYVNMILNGSNQILAAKRLHAPSIETELRLQLKMSSLGQAFEYDTDDEVVVQR